jgi:hypothetical protein
MIKAVQQKLRETSILDESDLILSLVQVTDLLKKEKAQKKQMKEEFLALIPANKYFLVATIKRANNDQTPFVYLVKSNEKINELKLKLTWRLNELRTVTQSKDNCQFEVVFAADPPGRSLYQCESLSDRDEFLNTMWKLSEEFLKQVDRPRFVNLTRSEEGAEQLSRSLEASGMGGAQTSQFEMSKGEEDSLLRLMSECDFASSNAETFMNKLQEELLYLDTVRRPCSE